jgi:myo-inositol 2-dehydrogenase/D-chiro-inositol 1-dehydrogenase
MRIALFGAGRIGPLHARSLLASKDVEQVCIMDVVQERAAEVAAELGLAHARSVDEALDGSDAVVIAASTDEHPSLIRAALGRGLPTFCEKPLDTSLEGSVEVTRDIEASDAPFQLGFQRRFDAGYMEARRLIVEGAMGNVYLVVLHAHDPAPATEEYIAHSGGTFRDQAIHDLDALRYLTGSEVVDVYADGSVKEFPVFAKYDDLATTAAILRMADGTLALMATTRHDPLGHDVRTEVFGTRDSISVGVGPKTPLRSVEPDVPPPPGPPWEIFLDRWEDAYRAELLEFVRVARGEVPSPCGARNGVEALRIAEALTIAARERRTVAMSEIPA